MRIIIVDDNEDNRIILKKMLQRAGHVVQEAQNGEEALNLMRASAPDMIISDILMPVMDGFQLCRQVKGDDTLNSILFVFYTATYTDLRDEEFALSLGAERFIRKPQEPEAFVGMLREVIGQHKAGHLAAKREAPVGETVYLKLYNETLIRKLEDKMKGLEEVNKVLEQEITERKQLEAKILESQRMSTIAHLVSGVAHEVRNPLNAILAVTEALSLELKEDSEHRIYLDHIRSQVDRLSVLMRDLLDLGKPIQFSNMKRETLSEICEAAVNSWKEITSFKTHQVRIVYPKEVSSMNVVADRSRCQQVIFNILENAAQHSPEETEIEFSILPMGASSLRVRISDRGSGIPQENLSQVFEPFFTTRRDGIGLGLSVVKQIVESHGGNIRIYNNDPPPGCTVEISLPIAQEDRG